MLITNQDELNAHLDAGRARRTDVLLAKCATYPEKEWNWLHGILCMDMGQEGDDYQLIRSLFDSARVAERLDDLNRQAREQYLASKPQERKV